MHPSLFGSTLALVLAGFAGLFQCFLSRERSVAASGRPLATCLGLARANVHLKGGQGGLQLTTSPVQSSIHITFANGTHVTFATVYEYVHTGPDLTCFEFLKVTDAE